MSTTTSHSTFLYNLGLISGQDQRDANARFDGLNWDELINSKPVGRYPALVRIDEPDSGESPYFNSYSGTDVSIYLLFDDGDSNQGIRNFRPFREIQTLSVSSARSVHPVRRLGESHVTEYTRGARTIAGSIVCISGDRDPLLKMATKSIREKSADTPFFTDELSSFSILIMAGDEYGHISHAALSDVTLTNFGQTFSADDMYLENTYTYVARFYHPLLPDPTVLNRLPQNYGSQNKLSAPFKNGHSSIPYFIGAQTLINLGDAELERAELELISAPLKEGDGSQWMQVWEWMSMQPNSNQGAK